MNPITIPPPVWGRYGPGWAAPADTARIVGSLAGDPVLYLALDAADHPLRPPSPLHLNSTVIWLGWRGQWIHARQTWRWWLTDPWTEAEAAEVWAEMGWPE